MYVPELIGLPIEGHLDHFQCLTSISQVAVNTCAQVFAWTIV